MNGVNFRDIDPKSNEDMKAAIYAWGGPKPSLVSKTKLDFDTKSQMMMLMYLEKRFDPDHVES